MLVFSYILKVYITEIIASFMANFLTFVKMNFNFAVSLKIFKNEVSMSKMFKYI